MLVDDCSPYPDTEGTVVLKGVDSEEIPDFNGNFID